MNGSSTASLATLVIWHFGSSSQYKDGRTGDIRNRENSHTIEKHSGCGDLLLVSNHTPLFHIWCPPTGAPLPGGPIRSHGQIQMPRCLSLSTLYSPCLPSQRKKKKRWIRKKETHICWASIGCQTWLWVLFLYLLSFLSILFSFLVGGELCLACKEWHWLKFC